MVIFYFEILALENRRSDRPLMWIVICKNIVEKSIDFEIPLTYNMS